MDLNKLEHHQWFLQSMCIIFVNLQGICHWSVSRDCLFPQSKSHSMFTSFSMKLHWCAYIRLDVGVCRFRCRCVIPLHQPKIYKAIHLWFSEELYFFLIPLLMRLVCELLNTIDSRKSVNMARAEPLEFFRFNFGKILALVLKYNLSKLKAQNPSNTIWLVDIHKSF